MKTIFFKELKLTRKMLIIWLALITLLTGFAAIEFVVLKDTMEQLAQLADTFPKIVLVMFGLNGADLTTTAGLYQCVVFWTNLLAFFFAGFLGVFAVAREEKFGTSEFLFSKPYKRSSIVWVKIWAAITNLAIFAFGVGILSFLGIILSLGDMSIVGLHIATTTGMFITQVILFSIGLFISSFANYKIASLLTMLAVVVFYVINFALDYAGTMNLNFLTPIRYFELTGIVQKGLNLWYVALSLAIITACFFAASERYAKKDLR
ncbi:MAG: ABC transporter permease [Fibromonadaceae bacterium]|jgi:ABC-2 type transport system permease protein|nr:ABC transporter permease [Fibromonadaceae bacterium]